MTIIHAETRIPFQIGGEQFAALGFLQAGEESCLLEDALRRLRTERPVANHDDWLLLDAWRSTLRAELRGYTLVTARSVPGGAIRYSVLQVCDAEWQTNSMHYARRCDEKYLVICRVT